jgi:O-antigen/teichoic acid export membrane protein
MSSFLTWFTFFEIGLGSGLRNKLAEALAVKDYKLGKIYVSTTYAVLTIVIVTVGILFFIGNNFIDWSALLNTNKNLSNDLSCLSLIVFGFFFLQFIFKLIGIVLYADQRPAMANSFGTVGNLFALGIIYILTKMTKGSLLYFGWTLSSIPVLILIIASFYFYKRDYRNIAPSFKFVDFKYSKNLLSLGLKFFFIQISTLLLFQSSNIIIAQYFGPKDVTSLRISILE